MNRLPAYSGRELGAFSPAGLRRLKPVPTAFVSRAVACASESSHSRGSFETSESELSFQHIQAAYGCKAPGFKEKSVLICLAFHKNKKNGQCNPSISLIAEECQMSRPLVVRCLQKLKAASLLFITKNGRTSQYDFTHKEQLQRLTRVNFRSNHGVTSEVKSPSSECSEPKEEPHTEQKEERPWTAEELFKWRHYAILPKP